MLRHLPAAGRRACCVGDDADPVDVELCLLAAATVGAGVRARGTSTGAARRVRILGDVDDGDAARPARRVGVTVDPRRPVADGEIELRRWAREQAVSITAHRYGRPIDRGDVGSVTRRRSGDGRPRPRPSIRTRSSKVVENTARGVPADAHNTW